ncbi:MAG: adenylyl-sulfate kinase [Anaeromyxobacter sp.]|nr:adenylyl-sulfate kinase [Anaeromyxobacter sp.]
MRRGRAAPAGPARRGAVAWLTGLPSSGKSTLGRRLAARLRAAGRPAALLDSDALRAALGRPAGRGPAERAAFYRALARLAALLARQGLLVVVAATASRRAFRARARALAPAFLEVHLATPEATCRRRDPKGLYAGAAAGRVRGLPGAGAAYQPPLRPDVTARGGRDAAALEAALAGLVSLADRAGAAQPARRTGTRRRPKRPGAASKRPARVRPQAWQRPSGVSR